MYSSMSQLSLESRLLESKTELSPTLTGLLPTLCLPEADSMAGEARNSPLLPVGTRSGKQAGTGGRSTSFSSEDVSLIPVGHLGILPCWRNWFQGPSSLLHLLEGSWGLGALILSISWSSLLFSSLGKSTCYLCISRPFTKLIKP